MKKNSNQKPKDENTRGPLNENTDYLNRPEQVEEIDLDEPQDSRVRSLPKADNFQRPDILGIEQEGNVISESPLFELRATSKETKKTNGAISNGEVNKFELPKINENENPEGR